MKRVSGDAGRRFTHLFVFALLCLIAAGHTLPLLTHPDALLPGRDIGDNTTFVWNLWWMRQAVATGESFFHSPALMAPLGVDLALHTHTAVQGWLAATVLSGMPLVQAQNLLLVVALPLNGLSVYALAIETGASLASAAVAGMLFVVAPQVTLRLMGHFNLVLVWPLVLACWAFVRMLRRRTAVHGVLLGLLAALVAYSDYYLFVFFVLFAAVFAPAEMWAVTFHPTRRQGRAFPLGFAAAAVLALAAGAAIAASGGGTFTLAGVRISARSPTNAFTLAWLAALASVLSAWRPGIAAARRPSTRGPVRSLGAALAVGVAAVAPLALAAINVLQRGDYVTQAAGLRSGPQGVDLGTLVLGPPFHGAAGAGIRSWYERIGINVMESSAWIGATLSVLLLLAVRHRRDRDDRTWLLIALVFFVWALGPYLIAFGANTGVVLPQAIARYVPLLNNARMPGRAMIPFSIFASVAAARHLSARGSRTAIVACALIGLVESLAAPLPTVTVPMSSAQSALADRSIQGAVLPIPFGVRDGFGQHGLVDHSAMYFQTLHGRPIAGGFVARMPPRVYAWYDGREPFRALMAIVDRPGAPAALPPCELMKQGLDDAHIAFVVVNRAMTSPAMRDVLARMPVAPVASDDTYDVLRVVDCAPRA